MLNESLLKKFRNKIANEGRSLVWFKKKYLPDCVYSSFIAQINEFNPIKDETIKAIRKYIREE